MTSGQKGASGKSTKDEAPVTSTSHIPSSASQLPPTLPPITNQTQPEMSRPRVAIIIYTMYGHIAKRS